MTYALVAAMWLASAAAPLASGARAPAPPPSPPEEQLPPKQMQAKLLAVLKSDATQKEKADACRRLARIATKDAVPTLAALLTDEKYSHMARYAMEAIPDPCVDDALREALGKAKGRPLVGIIGSIGVRRDAKAVEPLAKLLASEDPDAAQGAARALGKIGTSAAAKAIDGALAGVPAPNRLAFCEGLFRCAESLAAQGSKDEALAIYDRLRGLPEAPHQVRAGGLRGAVLARGKDGLPLLMEAVRGNDFVMVEAAARTAMELPGPEATQALAAELAKLPADKQVLVIQVLGKRGDAAALPALFAAAKSGDKTVRVAAIRALPEIGNAAAAPVLVQLLGDAEREVAQVAQESLAALPGPEVDAAIVSLLRCPDAQTRAFAIDLLGRRRVTGSLPALLKAAEDADETVRIASLKVLSDLAGAPELPAMLGLLAKTRSAPETQAAEAALAAICLRQTDRTACAERIVAALARAEGASKLPLLRVLATVGGAKALQAVRAAAKESGTETRDAALRVLCDWPTVEALPDLAQLAKTSTDRKLKTMALRGYVRLIPQQDVPAGQKLASLKDAMALADRKEEKKLVLAALGNISTAESLALVAQHLADPDLKEEASMAAVTIAEKIAKSHPAQVADAMKQVSTATANPQVLKRAKALLKQPPAKPAGK
jgi:HEAT repeat protein